MDPWASAHRGKWDQLEKWMKKEKTCKKEQFSEWGGGSGGIIELMIVFLLYFVSNQGRLQV